MGLSTAVTHLKNSESKSKVVILLTDGENNAGSIGPVQAAEIAKAMGVRVYTVGLGTDGTVMSPVYRNADGEYTFAARSMTLNTQLLEEMARLTKGQFFRTRSPQDLQSVYSSIDLLEKTVITSNSVRRTLELYFWLLDAAFCLLVLEMLLRWGPLRVITV